MGQPAHTGQASPADRLKAMLDGPPARVNPAQTMYFAEQSFLHARRDSAADWEQAAAPAGGSSSGCRRSAPAADKKAQSAAVLPGIARQAAAAMRAAERVVR